MCIYRDWTQLSSLHHFSATRNLCLAPHGSHVLAVASKTCAKSDHNGGHWGKWGNASCICMSPLNAVTLDLGPFMLQRPWKCKGVHRSVTHIPAFNWSHPCCRVPVPCAAQLSKSGRACDVLTLASCGCPCKISCINPHMRQQTLYDRWTYKFSHAFTSPSTSPMIIEPPGTPMRKRCPGHTGCRHINRVVHRNLQAPAVQRSLQNITQTKLIQLGNWMIFPRPRRAPISMLAEISAQHHTNESHPVQ